MTDRYGRADIPAAVGRYADADGEKLRRGVVAGAGNEPDRDRTGRR